jgi:hypothetical protein
MELEQAWAMSAPRATSGPRRNLMWPANYNFSFLDSIFILENMLKIQNIFNLSYFFYAFGTYSTLKVNALALGYLTCL